MPPRVWIVRPRDQPIATGGGNIPSRVETILPRVGSVLPRDQPFPTRVEIIPTRVQPIPTRVGIIPPRDDLTSSERRDIWATGADMMTRYDVIVAPFAVSTAHMTLLRSRERLIAREIDRDAVRL